ncbi:MAG: DNA (cytosine-5-)-methyltransferase [Gammaproteobacteria bacterium]|nr:DNA (cytosine-5-)-methyltransferase [Gammaproteobacteria bacterium]
MEFQTVGELFSGPGGGAIGASMSCLDLPDKKIRIRHSWATDFDRDTCDTYKKNISHYERAKFGVETGCEVVCADVNALDLSESGSFSAVDGLIFGFPCNDFSMVGESKGMDGKFGPLYKHGITVLNRVDRPKWFIAENVGGLSSANGGSAFAQILREMDDAGYVLTAHKYKFEEYGIPQARHRIIIVGFERSLGIKFKVPKQYAVRMTAGEALSDIPKHLKHQELTRQSKQVVERLKHIKPGENAWNADIPKHLQLNVASVRLSHIYKRLDPNKPAYTVTGSGGGGTHMYHWSEDRALTNRERARLQTFPDWFEFCGSKESVRKQIGMAIPPKGMKVIVDAVLSSIYGIEYDIISSNIDVEKILK